MDVVEIYRGFTIEEIKMTLHYKGKNHGDMPTFYGARNNDNCIATANTVEELKKKIDIFIDGGTDMKTFEVQLGIFSDGAKDGNVDYNSPEIILIVANHDIGIEEVEKAFENEIANLGCDCVYGITELEEWDLKDYADFYNSKQKYYI